MAVLERNRSRQEMDAARKSGVVDVHCRGVDGKKEKCPPTGKVKLPPRLF